MPRQQEVRRGCLIVNLGSPEELSEASIRSFLRRFLSDRRVVDLPRVLWQPILRSFVLRKRPGRILEQYERVWTPEGSPLMAYTVAQRDQLAEQLDQVEVRYAMTYTSPSIVESLRDWLVDEVTVLPLFPQYAPSTVAPVIDQVAAFERAHPDGPVITTVRDWATQPEYVAWYAEQLGKAFADEPADKVVFSYHSVPERKRHGPAEYADRCRATTEAIIAHPDCPDSEWEITYQSTFGPGRWLGPATLDRAQALPGEGVRSVLVCSPGFVADCIETSYELRVLMAGAFTECGGERFRVLTPLNSDVRAGEILAAVYRRFTR